MERAELGSRDGERGGGLKEVTECKSHGRQEAATLRRRGRYLESEGCVGEIVREEVKSERCARD